VPFSLRQGGGGDLPLPQDAYKKRPASPHPHHPLGEPSLSSPPPAKRHKTNELIEIAIPQTKLQQRFSKEQLWKQLQGYKQIIEGYVVTPTHTLIYGRTANAAAAIKDYLAACPGTGLQAEDILVNVVCRREEKEEGGE